MIEILNDIDTRLFLFLNSFNNEVFDIVMSYITITATWIPFYILLIYFIYKKYKFKYGSYILIFLILSIAAADFGSVHLFKNVFHRLRPCHNIDLQDLIHLVNSKCGGQFGFISSHAANVFSIAMFISLLFKNKYVWISMMIWAMLISYSRIYLGVHYPGDILGGALWGMLVSYLFYSINKRLILSKLQL